jgi:class 3 adenylate cyclase/predicted ATPase
MTFEEILTQVRELLEREGRVAYRILKRRFELNDEDLEDLKADLIDAKRLAVDEDSKVLVWAGTSPVSGSTFQVSSSQPPTPSSQTLDARRQTLDSARPEAERRQLTVLFCDLVGSTALSEQLDPEEYREVVRAYQETCATVIRRYAGHTAQHLGDGILVYFGYPAAHEDDAQRAVRTGLEIIEALQSSPSAWYEVPSPPVAQASSLHAARMAAPPEGKELRRVQVRIGIHTGLVVIGEIGSSEKREILAMGETPNIAARLQGLAEPDTVVISGVTHRLVQGLFECQDRGLQELKGISTPLPLYRVVKESEAQSRFEAAVSKGLTPLVGREEELGLLRRRWTQAKEGAGQVVLLSGEAGIGKSRLVQELKEQIVKEGATRIEFRCSAYHQNSAFYPLIEHLQRLLHFAREDSLQTKIGKLTQTLAQYRFPQTDTLPLFAALLSLPHPEGAPPLTLSPQKQKQKTQEALVAWVVEETQKAPVYCAWEDLHWADPSTLEVLTLLLDQVPTTRLLALLTFRPEFMPPWGNRSHLSQMTLSRLGRPHVETMVEKVTRGKALPSEVVQQIVAKTDGVPLFVEELTKTVMESGLYVGATHASPLPPLAIPSTLQDSLMARLDRLAPVREVAQLGAILGREFSYELLHAVCPVDEGSLQQGLRQLVEVELLYQHGLPPQATYLFKHALIQDTAYQSLLKSTRQQYHRQIAQVLEEKFSETKETQPELLAHHYTEAGLVGQAIPYWQQAGQRASQRSAYKEAISHLARGLELLKTLPDTLERVQQELVLQLALGGPLIATKGYASPEVGKSFTRARELCQQRGETPELFSVLGGLMTFYANRGEWQTAHELAEQLLSLAQRVQDPTFLMAGHAALGTTLFRFGELVPAREHLEQSLALYDSQQHRSLASLVGHDVQMANLSYVMWTLWVLGYPDQALKRAYEALTWAQELSHPFSLAWAFNCAASVHLFRREWQAAQERAEAAIMLATEQGFPVWRASGTIRRGKALAEQGQTEEGITQMRQGLTAYRATGGEAHLPKTLSLLAEAYGKVGQAEEGLTVLAEALAMVNKNGERFYEAEIYRLKGELTLQSKVQSPKLRKVRSSESEVTKGKSKGKGQKSKIKNPQHPPPNTEHPSGGGSRRVFFESD